MRNNSQRFDLQSMVTLLRERFGGWELGNLGADAFNTASKPDFRPMVLECVKVTAKNGHQILTEIAGSSTASKKPNASDIYPLLEQLVDEGLVTATQSGERKLYKSTKDGKAALAAMLNKQKAAEDHKGAAKSTDPWPLPRWLDLNGKVVKASGRLAKSLTDVAQLGTLEQQERVAELLDETRKKVHAILAEDTKIAD